MEAHVVWGDGEPFKSDILDHYVRIAHSPPFFSFGEEGVINFLHLDLLNLIGNTVTLGEPPRGVTGYVVEGTGYIANTLRC